MQPTPKGWPRLTTAVFYDDAAKAIDWLVNAFGFEVRLKVDGENGVVEHSEVTFGESLMMIGDTRRQKDKQRNVKSPKALGGANTQAIMLFVDDVDAHCERARKAGARITMEPTVSDYGEDYWADKTYEAVDLEGHYWWFCRRIRG
ncbi:MAG: VOC family protein [Archangium sp.]